jgi:CHASE3 domain sensor protein
MRLFWTIYLKDFLIAAKNNKKSTIDFVLTSLVLGLAVSASYIMARRIEAKTIHI